VLQPIEMLAPECSLPDDDDLHGVLLNSQSLRVLKNGSPCRRCGLHIAYRSRKPVGAPSAWRTASASSLRPTARLGRRAGTPVRGSIVVKLILLHVYAAPATGRVVAAAVARRDPRYRNSRRRDTRHGREERRRRRRHRAE